MALFRNGELDEDAQTLEIDNLDYIYENNSNRLSVVHDNSLDPNGFKDDSDVDPFDQDADYSYDLNGNMKSDANKGINKIVYNHLNLPTEIMFGGSGNIYYLYDATGKKLRKIVHTNNNTTDVITSYLDGFQYKNGIIQFFPTAEGYANRLNNSYEAGDFFAVDRDEPDLFSYVYNYTDHLGNIRLSYTKEKGTNVLKIVEENHYYPFGLKHNNYNSSKMLYAKEGQMEKQKPFPPYMAMSYNYKYNGKEFQDELGLNFYDYGFRNYDSAIGRWMNTDPLAETSRRYSPYAYALDNPVYYIDPDGMMAIDGDPVKTVVNSNQVANTFTYDDKGKTVGTDKIQQTVVSTMTVTNSDGQAVQTMNTTTMTTVYVDSKGNTTGQATEYSTNSINTKNEDGTWTRTDAIETSKTLDIKETSKELQGAVKEVQDFKREEKISPVQAEGRQNEKENKTAGYIGKGIGFLGGAVAKLPIPHAKTAGLATTGIGGAIGTIPQITNPTNPENITLIKRIK